MYPNCAGGGGVRVRPLESLHQSRDLATTHYEHVFKLSIYAYTVVVIINHRSQHKRNERRKKRKANNNEHTASSSILRLSAYTVPVQYCTTSYYCTVPVRIK